LSDPLSLLPLALASREGRIDGTPASQYVAAGLTLLQRSAPLVRALTGRRAGILLPTGPAFLTALAASEGHGAVLMNPLASPPELAYQIADADIGAVFTSSALAVRLPGNTPIALLDDAPRSARVAVGGAVRDVDLGSHFALELEGDPDAAGSAEEAVVVYTSAMHGRPLGAILSHGNLLFIVRSTLLAAAITPDDHALAALPFSHLFGFVVAGVAPLLAGASVTTMSRFDPVRALEIIEREGATMFVGVPSMYIAMLDVLQRGGESRPGVRMLRLCICGGAPLAPGIQRRWEDLTGVQLRQGYGLTEASSGCLFNGVATPNVVGTLGRAYPGVEVSIRDARTFASTPDGAVGEICVRGQTVFQGYVHAPGAVPRGLEIRDGWLHTGDLGMRRPDGSVEFHGLLKSMFTRNGFNIYPRELETAIAELLGVTEVRVRSTPDPAKENSIVVDVRGAVSVDDVRLWCAARLSAYKQPSIINVAP
jgi:long-chain acyl-CoA synthetase